MSDFTIDNVSIQIEATAKSASDTVDKLLRKVQQLTSAMNTLKTSTQGLSSSLSALRSLDAQTAASLRRLETIRAAQARTAAATEEASQRMRVANARAAASIEQLQERTTQARLRTESVTARNAAQEEILNNRIIQAQERTEQSIIRTERLRRDANGNRRSRDNVSDDLNDEADAYDRLSNVFNKIKALGMSAVFYKIGDAIGSLVTKSNEYIENLNLFMVQMGEFSNEAISFINLLEEKLGVDPSQSMRYMGFFMQIADSIGVASDQAFLLSKNFTLLAYDLSSFLNIDIEAAMEKLRSGLVGEVEPLRAVGYAITENTLQQTLNEAMTRKQYEAYKKLNPEIAENTNVAILNEQAVGLSVRKLTEAQKVELRYVAVMNQATKAMTDMSETLNTPANQMRILRQQIEMTARALGNIFIPIMNKVLPILIAFAQIIREIATVIANLVGFKLPEVDWERDFASGAGAATDAIDDVTDATEKAKKAAKDFTAPFDELNILKKDSDSKSGADDEDALGGISLFEQLPDYTSFLQDAIGLNVDGIKEQLEDLLQLVAAIAAGLAAWKIAQALLDNLPKIKEQFVKIRDTLKDIREGNTKLGDTIGKNAILAGTFGVAVGVWTFHFLELYRNSENFRKGLERVKEIFDTISEAVSILADGIYLYLIEPLLDVPIIGDVLNMIVGAFKEIKDFLSGMGLDIFGSDLMMVLTGIVMIVTKLNPVVGVITLVIEVITLLVRALGGLDNASFQNFKDGIINGAKEIVSFFRNFEENVEAVKTTIKNAFDEVMSITGLDKVWEKITGGSKTAKEAVDTTQEGIKGLVQSTNGVGDEMLTALGLDKIGEGFNKLKEDASNASTMFEETMKGLPSKIGEIPNTIKTSLGGAFSSFATNVGDEMNKAKEKITTFTSDVPTIIGNGFSNLAVNTVQSLDGFVTGVSNKFTEVTTNINDTFGTNLPTTVEEALNNLTTNISTGFDGTVEKISTFATNANNSFDEFMIGTGDMGAKVVEFKNSVMSNFKTAYDDMKEKLNNMVTEGDNSWADIVTDTGTRLGEWLDTVKDNLEEGNADWEKWWTDIKDLFKETWKKIKQKWDEDISTWWSTSVSPWFTLDKWLGILDNVREAIVTTFQNAIRSATNLINNFIDNVNDRMKFEWDDVEIAGETVFSGGMIQLFRIPHVPQLFAQGGFPSAGDMFIANEAGPEMVGSIGNKSAVVNNDQIVTAVAQGVYAAVLSAMSQQEQQPLVVELDGEVIYNNQKKIERSRGLGNFSMGSFQR